MVPKELCASRGEAGEEEGSVILQLGILPSIRSLDVCKSVGWGDFTAIRSPVVWLVHVIKRIDFLISVDSCKGGEEVGILAHFGSLGSEDHQPASV